MCSVTHRGTTRVVARGVEQIEAVLKVLLSPVLRTPLPPNLTLIDDALSPVHPPLIKGTR